MKFREDVLHKIIIQKTIGLVVITLIFIILCDFGFKEMLEPFRIYLLGLLFIWIVSVGFIMFKKV